MRKNWKRLSVLLVVALVITLTGCGQKASSIVGKWSSPEFASAMTGDMTEIFGENAAVYFEFSQDGKMNFMVNDKPMADAVKEGIDKLGLPEEAKATMPNMLDMMPQMSYRLDGNKIIIDIKMGENTESTTGEYKLEGDKLIITAEGRSITFNKVK